MNERMLKLFQQSLGVNYIPVPIEDHVPLWTEKFAELIVRECIDVLDKAVYLATREDGEQEHIDVVLLEHFDIEEN